jgi:hypothetical protein
VAYGNDKFIAVAGNKGAYSDNGITWVEISLPGPGTHYYNWSQIVYGDGKFVLLEYASDNIFYSPDGINWTLAMVDSDYWQAIAYGE